MKIFDNIKAWWINFTKFDESKKTKNMTDAQIISEMHSLYDRISVFETASDLDVFRYDNLQYAIKNRGYDVYGLATGVIIEKRKD
jgi:hypothetical protein